MGNKIVVLVVEDDVFQRLLAVDIVEAAGFTALEARSGDEALQVLENRADISILFTDVRMPGNTNGLQLARFVSERYPCVQIIIVSGNASPADAPMPLGSAFFAKPYRDEQITRTLNRFATLH
ncbi:MAG: response regulator [Rhizobiales bacterium]|nr:response regulator [Hyphomicrobiales bacterium]